jgi:hypothetical protein
VISTINKAKQRQADEDRQRKKMHKEEAKLAEERQKASMRVPEFNNPQVSSHVSSICSLPLYSQKAQVKRKTMDFQARYKKRSVRLNS